MNNATHSCSFKSNKSPDLQEKIRRDLYDAFAVWQENTLFVFNESPDEVPDILVEFHKLKHGDGSDFDGPGMTLAHAFYPKSGQVHFDDDESWYFGSSGDRRRLGASFFDTAVHELGHTLGLAHSKVPEAIMMPIMRHDNRYMKLNQDEIDGIKDIYGDRPINSGQNRRTGKNFNYNYNPVTETPRPAIPERPTPPGRPINSGQNERTGKHFKYNHNSEIFTPRPTIRNPNRRTPPSRNHLRTPFNVPVISNNPAKCSLEKYDAIATIKGVTVIFKDQYMWRIMRDYISGPTLIKNFWKELPAGLKRIDAVYENSMKNTIFFIGNMSYIFTDRIFRASRSLNYLALPTSVHKVNAVVMNKYKTFIFAGKKYWE